MRTPPIRRSEALVSGSLSERPLHSGRSRTRKGLITNPPLLIKGVYDFFFLVDDRQKNHRSLFCIDFIDDIGTAAVGKLHIQNRQRKGMQAQRVYRVAYAGAVGHLISLLSRA